MLLREIICTYEADLTFLFILADIKYAEFIKGETEFQKEIQSLQANQ